MSAGILSSHQPELTSKSAKRHHEEMARNEWDAAADAADTRCPSRLLPPPAAPAQMQNERHLSLRGSEDAAQKHGQSLRAMAESLSMARETAHTLSMQSEQLGRNERAVEDAQYAVDVSKRIMRGMTWSGWIANAFTAAPQRDGDTTTGVRDTVASGVANGQNGTETQITMGFICPECKVMFKNPEELAMHYGKAHDRVDTRDETADPSASRERLQHGSFRPSSRDDQQTTMMTTPATDDIHEQFLRDLEPQLAELKQASLALGNALDTQNHQLDRLENKIDTVHDGMKRVSVQAKKLTGRRLPVVFRFRCAFQEVESRKFLREMDGEAMLGADVLVDGCTFRAYTLGDDTEMWGFQSESSSFFLGLNRFGNLKIRGSDLQSYEQFAIESGKSTTTLFAFASYFGYGGWVTRKDDDGGKLTIIRGSPENKSAAAQFKLINLDQIQSELTTAK